MSGSRCLPNGWPRSEYGCQVFGPANPSTVAPVSRPTLAAVTSAPGRRGSGVCSIASVSSTVPGAAIAPKWFTHFVGPSASRPSATAVVTAVDSVYSRIGPPIGPRRPDPMDTTTSSTTVSSTGTRRPHVPVSISVR